MSWIAAKCCSAGNDLMFDEALCMLGDWQIRLECFLFLNTLWETSESVGCNSKSAAIAITRRWKDIEHQFSVRRWPMLLADL